VGSLLKGVTSRPGVKDQGGPPRGGGSRRPVRGDFPECPRPRGEGGLSSEKGDHLSMSCRGDAGVRGSGLGKLPRSPEVLVSRRGFFVQTASSAAPLLPFPPCLRSHTSAFPPGCPTRSCGFVSWCGAAILVITNFFFFLLFSPVTRHQTLPPVGVLSRSV
jgi:hypothetical protein